MGELISRQEALEAIQDAHHHVEVMSMMDNGRLSGLGQASNIIRDLPSAQPDTTDADTISRKMAIEELGEEPMVWTEDDEYAQGQLNMWEAAKIALENLPSAVQKCTTGKWILVNDQNGQHFVCDHCGEWRYHQDQNFCGHCGSYNGGEQE